MAEKARQTAEDASESKSRFLANMSHEIRTPLGAILGFTDLLRDPNIEAEERLEFIETITRNGHALSHLINDILDLSKVEAGKINLESITFSLHDLLDELKNTLGMTAREKAIRLEIDITEPLPGFIVSDMGRIRQVLLNIIGNAIKFTTAGQVRVVASSNNSDDSKTSSLTFTVHDTGRGIGGEHRSNLFQPFIQGDNSTTRIFGGTGLGLVLSKRLAEALGGDVRLLTSNIGRGSIFEVSFLVNLAEKQLPTKVTNVHSKEKLKELLGIRVLVAEDSPDNQIMVKRMLTRRGAIVDFASNGQEAVEHASVGQYDVILMDVQMPVMDGHAATRELRNRHYIKPIIALTAHAMKEERDKCTESGCDDYLTKPIDHSLLIRTVQKWAITTSNSIH